MTSLREKFEWIVQNNYWACEETPCGSGSTLEATESLRPTLQDLLVSFARSPDSPDPLILLDVPCGDMHWIEHVELPKRVHYVGVDVVPDLIAKLHDRYLDSDRYEFYCYDATVELPTVADVVLVKDLFLHLSIQDIWACLRNIKKTGAKILLCSSSPLEPGKSNEDIETGGGHRHLDLESPPFSFPKPVRILPANIRMWTTDQLESYW